MKASEDKHCESWQRYRWSPSSLHRRDGWMEGRHNITYRPDPRDGNKKTKLGGAGGKQRRGEERGAAGGTTITRQQMSPCLWLSSRAEFSRLFTFSALAHSRRGVAVPSTAGKIGLIIFTTRDPARRRRLSRGAAGGHLRNGPVSPLEGCCAQAVEEVQVCVCVCLTRSGLTSCLH